MNVNRGIYFDGLAKGQVCTKSMGPRAQRWARGERTRAHPQTAERRRNVAQKIPAARAAAVVGARARDIRSQPVAAEFTHGIDALHGQAGQVLHSFTSVAAWPGQLPGKHPRTGAHRETAGAPWRPSAPPRSPEGEPMARGSAAQATNREPRGNSELDGAHSALSTLWCQEENTTRYCGKVAAVKNVVFGPQSSCRRKHVASPKGMRRRAADNSGNRAAHFCLLRNDGECGLVQLRRTAGRREKCLVQSSNSVVVGCRPSNEA